MKRSASRNPVWRTPIAAWAAIVGIVPALLWCSLPRSVLAQEEEGVLAREAYRGLRVYSGDGVNLSELLARARRTARALPSAPGSASLLSPRWRSLGPAGTDSYGNRTSARVSSIAIHPTNPDIIYIGAAGGGVWRTDDAGASWRPLTDNECSLSMGSVVIDPVNSEIVYAGTGERGVSYSSYYGCGVLRSLDGGSSWEQLGGDVFVDRRVQGGARIWRILIDPATAGSATSTVVLAGSDYGVFRSADSGRTWKRVLAHPNPGHRSAQVALKPGDSSVVYAGIPFAGIYRSTDGGLSWTDSSPDFAADGVSRNWLREMDLAVVPSAPDILYASMEIDASPWLLFYRSDDGAQTWRHLEAEGSICKPCGFMALAVLPDHGERVYYGEVELHLSEDGGRSFRSLQPPDRELYVDQQHIVFDTLSGRDVMYVANDGGVYRSTDGGSSFTTLSTNLAITQFYPGIALHPSDPGVTLGGTQDQGTQRSSAGTSQWVKVLGADGGYAAFDAEHPDVWYGEAQWIDPHIGGPLKNGSRAVSGIDLTDHALFIPPIVMDPVDSKRLYFGTSRLYRTDNAANTWTPLFESPRLTGPNAMLVAAVAPSASDPNTVYIAASTTPLGFKAEWPSLSRAVYVTRDGGATWADVSTGLPARRFIADLAVHPTDPDRAYAVVGGFLTGHVFETTDGGSTWRDRTGNLPDMPVNAVLYDPADEDAVYVGTDLGVYYSSAGGGTWTSLTEGLPNVPVLDIAAQPGTGRLVASTIGRGMFEVPIEVPLAARTRPAKVAATVEAAADTTVTGVIIVAPVGRNDYAAPWSASASRAPWLVLDGGQGTGRGRFGYRIAAGPDLGPGDHHATITVTVAGTDPVAIPVAVRAEPALTLRPMQTADGIGVAGLELAPGDSVPAGFKGFGADSASWLVESAASWLTLASTSGGAADPIVWSRSAESLEPGLHEDTITVTAAGRPALRGIIVDRFEVLEPISAEDAVHHLLGLERLLPGQPDFLDWLGNRDDVFNAGDVLKWLDHCRTAGARSGCRPVAPSAAQSAGSLPGRRP